VRPWKVCWLLLSLLFILPRGPALGQDPDLQREIQESQRRLEAIREERARLQAEMDQIRGRVRDASTELRNIEQQITASRSVLAELDFQAEVVSAQVQETTAELLRTREKLQEDRAVLHRRVRDIYKRGPLHSLKVLLGADSFADLLTRYRYLQLLP
jgi:peptidoglycan hydrolase CwlO-like protein